MIGWIVAFAAWMLLAVALGVVMARRGYNGFGWGVTGAALGPIAVIVALTRHVPSKASASVAAGVVAGGRPGSGTVDVLLAIDGSDTSLRAAHQAVDLFARRLGAVTIATVVPLDPTAAELAEAEREVTSAAAELAGRLHVFSVEPRTVVLRGAPAEALRSAASDAAVDVLVGGSHGRGLGTLVLGSVAAALVTSAPVPVRVAAPHGVAAPPGVASHVA